MYSKRAGTLSTPALRLLKDKANVTLLAGSVLVVASILLPWWSLHSSIVNGQQALFDFTIGPLGINVNTIVGDPRALLAGLQAFYAIVTIALLPVSVSLALGAFHGVYCALRGRRGVRVLIAPLWSVIGLFWWAFYFLVVYSFFSALGLNIPATGSADLTWQGYQLAWATWGWDLGLWLGIAGTAVLFLGAGFALRAAKGAARAPEGARLAFGFHSIGLVLLALLNFAVMGLLLVSLKEPTIAWLLLVPVGLLFAMAAFARRPKAVAAGRKPFGIALPRIPKPSVPPLRLPDLGGKMKSPLGTQTTASLARGEGVACPQCGQRFPSQVQLDAHKLSHTVSAQAAEAKRKMDDLGRKLLGR